MNFTQAIKSVLRDNYANFNGRASRAEFWWYALFILIVQAIFMVIFMLMGGYDWLAQMWYASMQDDYIVPAASGGITFMAVLYFIFGLAVLVPNLAVTTRRFHDRGMSGWWVFGLLVASLIPFLGFIASIAILVNCMLPGNEVENQYGSKPLA